MLRRKRVLCVLFMSDHYLFINVIGKWMKHSEFYSWNQVVYIIMYVVVWLGYKWTLRLINGEGINKIRLWYTSCQLNILQLFELFYIIQYGDAIPLSTPPSTRSNIHLQIYDQFSQIKCSVFLLPVDLHYTDNQFGTFESELRFVSDCNQINQGCPNWNHVHLQTELKGHKLRETPIQ